MKKQKVKINESNEIWNAKLEKTLQFLSEVKYRLENGLFVVDGFEGGNRMNVVTNLGLGCKAIKDILEKGGITLTDVSVPVQNNRINESQLREIVKESVKKVLNELGDTPQGQAALGALQQRRTTQGNFNQADNVRNYATKQANANPGARRELNNANQRGREAYANYNMNRMTRDDVRNVIKNNSWK